MKRDEMAVTILAGIMANRWTVIPDPANTVIPDPTNDRDARLAEMVDAAIAAADIMAAKLAE